MRLTCGCLRATNLHDNAGWFIIFAGAILGVCAGLLWTAQGSLMLAYPTGNYDLHPAPHLNTLTRWALEENKGKYIAIFWGIFVSYPFSR